MEALKIIKEENLVSNSFAMGKIFRDEMGSVHSPMIEEVRGRGLLNAITIRPKDGKTAWDVCLAMKDLGLIAKPTHGHIIRFTPPLVINEQQMREATGIIKKAFKTFE